MQSRHGTKGQRKPIFVRKNLLYPLKNGNFRKFNLQNLATLRLCAFALRILTFWQKSHLFAQKRVDFSRRLRPGWLLLIAFQRLERQPREQGPVRGQSCQPRRQHFSLPGRNQITGLPLADDFTGGPGRGADRGQAKGHSFEINHPKAFVRGGNNQQVGLRQFFD
jgi:hypothetical protein